LERIKRSLTKAANNFPMQIVRTFECLMIGQDT
jgi:hypothetical protein